MKEPDRWKVAELQVHEEMVRDALSDLADEDYQRRAWSSRTPSGQSSLEECWERLFDGSGLGAALDSEAEVFGDQPDQCLRELDGALRRVPADASASEVLDSDEMVQVRSLASTTLSLLSG